MVSAIDTTHHIVTILVQDMGKSFPDVLCVVNSLIKKISFFHQEIERYVYTVRLPYDQSQNGNLNRQSQ